MEKREINSYSKEIFNQAKLIAEASLRQCYFNGKVLASLKNFSDYWARDTFWALPGMIAKGDCNIAKACLEYFLSYQREDGKIPRKIALDYNVIKYITGKSVKRKIPRPIYRGNVPITDCMDANALLIIAFEKYLDKTGDTTLVEKYYEQIKKAIAWYDNKFKKGFVREYLLANWMDTIFKNGQVLYTNVMYCEAKRCMAKIAQTLGKKEEAEIYENEYEDIKKRIGKEFWNGKYFDDQLEKHRHFDTAGNILACFFDIASEEQAKIILNKIENIKKDKLLPTVCPPYPFWKINPITYFFTMSDYQNGTSWLWIDLLCVAVKYKNNCRKESLGDFENICQIIIKNKTVHETYFNNGEPYDKLFWKSAVPFTWNSGIFLQVWEIMKNSGT
jgi:glycogen debranching enzyme